MKHDLRAVALRRLRFLPPLPYSMLVHLVYQHELTTFRKPMTFTQMVVAKKLRDKNPLYTLTADKLRCRDYVAEKVGKQYLIPLVQAVSDPRLINWDALPERCVVKARHGYNMNLFLNRSRGIDRDEVITATQNWLKTDVYDDWREWAYKDVEPGLVIEEFIGSPDNDAPPSDFKIYVFRGKAGMIQVDSDRFSGHKVNIFDNHWNELKFDGSFPALNPSPKKPSNFDEMIRVAEKLAADFDFARVDLYSVNSKIYFGEITHYPGAGCVVHGPKAFDLAIGELWRNGKPFPPRFVKTSSTPIDSADSPAA